MIESMSIGCLIGCFTSLRIEKDQISYPYIIKLKSCAQRTPVGLGRRVPQPRRRWLKNATEVLEIEQLVKRRKITY